MKKFLSVFLVVLMFVGMLPMTAIHTHAATAKYVKVTKNLTDWSGEYLIVYQDGNRIFDGSLTKLDAAKNNQTVTISNDTISTDSKYAFEIVKSGTSYLIKSASGYYIGATANSNSLNSSTSTKYTNTITYESGSVKIVGSGGAVLRFNANTSDMRFRYYKSSSYTGQKAIQLYKLEETTACAHNSLAATAEKPATCTENGNIAYWYCGDCQKYFGDKAAATETELADTVVSALGHNYVNGVCDRDGCGAKLPVVSFVVPSGVTTIPDRTADKDGNVELPAAGVPSGDHTYTFAGWTTDTVDNATKAPEIIPAGDYKANADITLHALYTYNVVGEGSTSTDYVLTDIANIKATDEVVITMTHQSTVYALTNGNGTSKAPAATTVTVSGEKISGTPADNLVWNIANDNGNFTIYPNGTTSTWLYCTSTNNGVRVGTNTAKVFTIDGTSGYLKHTGTGRYVGVYRTTPDWRCYTSTGTNINDQKLRFYVKTSGVAQTTYYTTIIDTTPVECEHTYESVVTAPDCVNSGFTTYTCTLCGNTYKDNEKSALGHTVVTDAAVAATCTETGLTEGSHCETCGEVLVKQEVVSAKGHNYVDGFCSECEKPQPEATSARYYIAAIRSSGNYFYMTSDLGAASTERYTAVDSGLTKLPDSIIDPQDGYVFVLIDNGDGVYNLQAEGVEGNNYLGWTSGNSGTLVAEANALKLTVEENENGTYNIHFAASDAERYLALNSTSGNNYFAWYKSGQKQDLTLIPIEEGCKHTSTTTTTEDATCTADGSVTVTCDDCGETISTEVIKAQGHIEVDDEAKTPNCTETGLTEGSHCETCGEVLEEQEVIPALGHSYSAEVVADNGIPAVVNTCACGEKKTVELKFTTTSLTLQNNIAINFKTSGDIGHTGDYEGFTDIHAIFTYGNREEAVYAPQKDDNKLVFTCRQISPSQIGDEITATLYGTFNGEKYSYQMTYSVAQYCYTELDNNPSADLKNLLIDLLFYCNAARAYTGYQGIDGYTGSVTKDYSARTEVGSYDEGVIENPVGSDCENPSAEWMSASLVIAHNTAIQFRVDAGEMELNPSMIEVTVGGAQYHNVSYRPDVDGTWLIRVEGLSAHRMREEVKVQLFDGDTAISHTVSYSIVTYAARMQNAAPKLVAMMRAMINYGDSALAYKNNPEESV